jgi:hypothetical protein
MPLGDKIEAGVVQGLAVKLTFNTLFWKSDQINFEVISDC